MDESQQHSQHETGPEPLTEAGTDSFGIDGTERGRQRPKDAEEQKRFPAFARTGLQWQAEDSHSEKQRDSHHGAL
jgi:hypothetical protein